MENKNEVLPTISSIVVQAITLTEEINPAVDKKQYALRMIKELIDNLPESDNKNFLIDSYVNNNISDTIDIIIDATKGKLDINKLTIKRVINKLLKCVLSCIKIRLKKDDK